MSYLQIIYGFILSKNIFKTFARICGGSLNRDISEYSLLLIAKLS
jgi:hypothetical protein